MRAQRWGTFVVAAWLSAPGLAGAEQGGSAAGAQAPAAGTAGAAAKSEAAPSGPTAKEWEEKLNGTSWELELISLADHSVKQKDTVTFQGRGVRSDSLSTEGYSSSNFTLTVQSDGSAVWETMQSKPGEGLAFWRGEVREESMQGVLSKQPTKGSPVEFAFTAKKVASSPPPAAPQPETPAASAPTPAAPNAQPSASAHSGATATVTAPTPAASSPGSQAEKKDKKKRRWF